MQKKIIPILLLLTFFFFSAKAQIQNDSLSQPSIPKEVEKPKKCIKKFKTLTDTYYGYPNLFGPVMRLIAPTGSHISSIGPTGAKVEFLITDDFGIGTDVSYSSVSATWQESKPDEAGNMVSYDHRLSSTAFRSMLSFNFHYTIKKRNEWYTSFKGGYYARSFSYTSNQPNDKPPVIDKIWTSNSWHAAMRWEIGGRFFVAKFLAFNYGVGIGGGPLVFSGVSSKF